MSVERVTARAEAVSMACVGTPERSFSRVRSRISEGGVSSINWTNGSITSENWTRCGMGMVSFSLSADISGLVGYPFRDTAPLHRYVGLGAVVDLLIAALYAAISKSSTART